MTTQLRQFSLTDAESAALLALRRFKPTPLLLAPPEVDRDTLDSLKARGMVAYRVIWRRSDGELRTGPFLSESGKVAAYWVAARRRASLPLWRRWLPF